MKTFILTAVLLSAFSALVVSSVSEADLLRYAEECMTEFKISEKQMNDTQSGVIKPADVPENIKCSLKCFLEKLTVMDKTSKISADNAKAKFPELEKTVMDKCLAMNGSSPCDTAYQVVNCFWSTDAM